MNTGPPARSTSVGAAWKRYAAMFLDPCGAAAVQRVETRRAFYAGAQAMLLMISQISDAAETDDAGADLVEALSQELQTFARKIEEGRA